MASGQVRSVSSLLLRPLDRGRAYAKYCDQRVCMSVCSHMSKTWRPNFTKFSVHVTCSRGTVLHDGNAMHYVLPVLWMTPFFHTLAQIQIQACSHRRRELFAATRQVAPPNCARGVGKDCYNCSRGGGEVCYPRLPCVFCCEVSVPCWPGDFRCWPDMCISSCVACDGYSDCKDDFDESEEFCGAWLLPAACVAVMDPAVRCVRPSRLQSPYKTPYVMLG